MSLGLGRAYIESGTWNIFLFICVFTIFFTTFVGRLFFLTPPCLHLFLRVLLFNAAVINGVVLDLFLFVES